MPHRRKPAPSLSGLKKNGFRSDLKICGAGIRQEDTANQDGDARDPGMRDPHRGHRTRNAQPEKSQHVKEQISPPSVPQKAQKKSRHPERQGKGRDTNGTGVTAQRSCRAPPQATPGAASWGD